MKTALCSDFSTVTEQPGQLASRIQMEMLEARYRWALPYCRKKRVLELACGAGMGLEPLSKAARELHAGDIDETNLRWAQEAVAGLHNVTVERLNAEDLPFEDASFDVALLFEAIYYLPDARNFLEEARRVLAPGGVLLIVTVNCEWTGFNPSPFHTRYFRAAELAQLLEESGFETRIHGAFPELRTGASALTGLLRRAAAKAHLIPRTMRGKAALKRIFYGSLKPVPQRLDLRSANRLDSQAVSGPESLERYRVLYAEATKK